MSVEKEEEEEVQGSCLRVSKNTHRPEQGRSGASSTKCLLGCPSTEQGPYLIWQGGFWYHSWEGSETISSVPGSTRGSSGRLSCVCPSWLWLGTLRVVCACLWGKRGEWEWPGEPTWHSYASHGSWSLLGGGVSGALSRVERGLQSGWECKAAEGKPKENFKVQTALRYGPISAFCGFLWKQ